MAEAFCSSSPSVTIHRLRTSPSNGLGRPMITHSRLPPHRSQTTAFLRSAPRTAISAARARSEEHTSELQSLAYLVCRLLLEKKKKKSNSTYLSKKKKIIK